MSTQYNPQDHIQPLVVAPRAEGILDQREITIQSYQTTVPFDFDALDSALETAWLTPQIRLGVFSRVRSADKKAINVVLGLQDELSVRAYDYDERRPLWFTWQDAIVDTVKIHYFRDAHGMIQFTTTGGGRRITDDRLHEFNSSFLKIPKDAVTKRQFDLEKLRELCFTRYSDRLYMVKFAEPSAKEYRSIDHALFQSRKYIDPDAERLKEISSDGKVIIESFDSDIDLATEYLVSAIQVRFFIRGLSGSLRLRFPKVIYKVQHKTIDEEATVFYRLVTAAVNTILDEDYYAHTLRTLDDLSVDLGVLPGMVELAPFREVLVREEDRRTFFSTLDIADSWTKWDPHLQAIDELAAADEVRADVASLVDDFVKRAPNMAIRLLAACQEDSRKSRIGGLVSRSLAAEMHGMPAELRAQVEASVLSWAVEHELDSWDIDADSSEITMLNLRWKSEDFAFDVFPTILWKLIGVLHSRLMNANGDAALLLRKYNVCMAAARRLPANHSKSCAAMRLVSSERVPKSPADGNHVLKEPVKDLCSLDTAVLEQFGLPLWPMLSANRLNGKVKLSNDGIGAALSVKVRADDASIKEESLFPGTDICSGSNALFSADNKSDRIAIEFEKLGRSFQLELPIDAHAALATNDDKAASLPFIVTSKRRREQARFRGDIDKNGMVVGASPGLLQVFESIHFANQTEGIQTVLLLGEPGVGKTHIAQLIHSSSNRSAKAFKAVNAGGGGGDINIQRGEWVGYGKGHGIQGIEKNGRPGHLVVTNGGTLFVDEFAALSQDLQVIFLSVLEKRSIEKVGGESFTPDVRCIFATNADPEAEVTRGALRRDLLDRISYRITIPPLRERRGDVLLLARKFADSAISEPCLVALLRYNWPGNIRELRSKIANAKARQKTDGKAAMEIDHLDLPTDIVKSTRQLDAQACRRELWTLADEMARCEGFESGSGLQRRAGEIMGVSESQASKMYREFGLICSTAASA